MVSLRHRNKSAATGGNGGVWGETGSGARGQNGGGLLRGS